MMKQFGSHPEGINPWEEYPVPAPAEKPLSDEEAVKQVHPDAIVWSRYWPMEYSVYGGNGKLIADWFPTEKAAWASARAKIAAVPEVNEPDGIGWCSSCNEITEAHRPKCACGDWLIFAADDKPAVLSPEESQGTSFPDEFKKWLWNHGSEMEGEDNCETLMRAAWNAALAVKPVSPEAQGLRPLTEAEKEGLKPFIETRDADIALHYGSFHETKLALKSQIEICNELRERLRKAELRIGELQGVSPEAESGQAMIEPVSELLNSMKVLDRTQRYMECRSDVLTKLMYELVGYREKAWPEASLRSKLVDTEGDKQELPPRPIPHASMGLLDTFYSKKAEAYMNALEARLAALSSKPVTEEKA